MDSDDVLLESRSCGRVIPGRGTWLLRDVSLTARCGERLAVVGPTGSGKTLLLRSLALLDKYQIVIMFLIATGTALGTVGVVLLSFRRLFNRNHQFRSDLLMAVKQH